jgi:hypothetical protein
LRTPIIQVQRATTREKPHEAVSNPALFCGQDLDLVITKNGAIAWYLGNLRGASARSAVLEVF